jgi:general secretion pathway protein H
MSYQRPPKTDRQAGFTLTELLIVLTILAMASSLVVARLPGQGRHVETRRTVQEVVSLVRATRLDAAQRGRSSLLRFAEDDRVFSTSSDTRVHIPSGLKVSLVSSRNLGADGIMFYPDGSSSGGRIRIANDREETVIEVDWLTGRYIRRSRAS